MAKRSQKKKRQTDVKASQVTVAQSMEQRPAPTIARSEFLISPWRPTLQALALAAATLWIYWPALHGGWLWDDDRLITENPQLNDLNGLWNTWFKPGSQVDYYPIEQTVLWIEWQLWHNDTLWFHAITLAFHLGSALLVWRLFHKMGLRLAWLGGLLFAIHPVQVESVAWLAELKNTLSLPPLLLAMCFYLEYEERHKISAYLWALGLFCVALLCKMTVVMFPVVILLHAWWKRGRIVWNDWKRSAPFFGFSLAAGLITILSGVWNMQFGHLDAGDIPAGGFPSRLVLAGQEIAFYFSKSVLPVELLPVYPKWNVDPASPAQYLPWLVLGGVIYGLWIKRLGWGRHALFGLGFFLINLAPCPGFIPAPNMGYAWTMDHFLYLPVIGLIGLAVAALGQIKKQLSPAFRHLGLVTVALVMILLSWVSRSYAALYLNSETLWTYELQHNPEAYPAYNNLGLASYQAGRLSEAIQEFEATLRIKPDYARAHYNLGFTLFEAGQPTEAIAQYQQALRIKPADVITLYNLGYTFQKTNRLPEAIEQYEEALRIKPDYAEAHNNLGNALRQTGRLPEAIDHFETALRIKPNYTDAHYNDALALYQVGRVPEAIAQFQETLRLKHDYAEAHTNLGFALIQTRQLPEALTQFEQAAQLQPQNPAALNNLGNALRQTGNLPESIQQYQHALQINPNDAEAHNDLGSVLLQSGRGSEAIAEFKEALRLKRDYSGAHCNLGVALEQAGQLSEAAEEFQQALQIEPDLVAAQRNLERLQALQKTAPAKK